MLSGYGYIGLIALAGVGRETEAIAAARKTEATALSRFRALIASARHFIEGNRADCLKAIEEAVAGALDMELVFYAARMLARLDEPRWALQELPGPAKQATAATSRRPAIRGSIRLRGDPVFETLVGRLREQHESNMTAFRDAGGPAILGAIEPSG